MKRFLKLFVLSFFLSSCVSVSTKNYYCYEDGVEAPLLFYYTDYKWEVGIGNKDYFDVNSVKEFDFSKKNADLQIMIKREEDKITVSQVYQLARIVYLDENLKVVPEDKAPWIERGQDRYKNNMHVTLFSIQDYVFDKKSLILTKKWRNVNDPRYFKIKSRRMVYDVSDSSRHGFKGQEPFDISEKTRQEIIASLVGKDGGGKKLQCKKVEGFKNWFSMNIRKIISLALFI